jgi:hypothetical protein
MTNAKVSGESSTLAVFLLTTIKRITSNFTSVPTYALGRFQFVRVIRRIYNKCFCNYSPNPAEKESVEIIDQSESPKIIRDLRSRAVFAGIKLNPTVLNYLLDEISRSSTYNLATHLPISLSEARAHNASNRPDKILIIIHQSNKLSTMADQISRSPLLLHIAKKYLGGITKIDLLVQTSLVAEASTEYRESLTQTVMFHYDVHALNFLYVFFYLTDCDRFSGAHEMILGSHRKKSLSLLFSTARKTDKVIYDTYPDSSWILEGEKGFGFIEDTSCFHRALPPLKRERVTLQIRYSG